MSEVEVDEIVPWINRLADKDALRAIREAAAQRLHVIEHQDEHGAGKPISESGWRTVRAPGAGRPA